MDKFKAIIEYDNIINNILLLFPSVCQLYQMFQEEVSSQLLYQRQLCENTQTQFYFNEYAQKRTLQLSVKSPLKFKDTVCLDLMQFYCPLKYERCIIICPTYDKAQILNTSEFLSKKSVVIHNGLDRRQRVARAKNFEQSYQKKCIITNSIHATHIKKIIIKMIIFTSPPKNYQTYNQVFNIVQNIEVVVVCYTTKQIKDLCNLEQGINKKLGMLVPPEVESDSEDQERPSKQKFETMQSQYKLVIKNIDFNVNWISLKQFLQKNSIQVSQIRVLIPRSCVNLNKNIKKTGFVICKDRVSFQNLLKMNGIYFSGTYLIVDIYQNRGE